MKNQHLPRSETPAIGEEPSSGPSLVSCGVPLTDPALDASSLPRTRRFPSARPCHLPQPQPRFVSRPGVSHRLLQPTRSAGTPANADSSHETTLSRIPLLRAETRNRERHDTEVTPGWHPKCRPCRPKAAEPACVLRRRGRLVPLPSTVCHRGSAVPSLKIGSPAARFPVKVPSFHRPRERSRWS